MDRVACRCVRPILLAGITLSLVVFGVTGIQPAGAAMIIVNATADQFGSGPECSLREAVQAANTDLAFGGCPAGSAADSITLPAGTYELSRAPAGDPDDNASGDLDVTQNLTLQGEGDAATVIDGALLDRVLHVDPGATPTAITLTLEDLTVQRGKLAAAEPGGGIWAEDRLDLHGVTVAANDTAGAGGGIKAGSPLSLTRSVVTKNVATQDGGGINADDTVSIADSTISDNTGDDGGGLDVVDTTITGSTITGNMATGLGAGPIKGDGGGIRGGPNMLSIVNSTISGNRGTGDGGGLSTINPPGATLTNATVTGNTADSDATGNGDGGGISTTTVIALSNSILAGNADATGENPDCSGNPTSGGYNLVGIVSAGCAFTPGNGDQTGTPASPLEPLLGPLVDNGGPTRTHALLPGSPAVDAAGPGAPPTDQRGVPRNSDIGAYELAFCQNVTINRVGTEGDNTLIGTPGSDGFLAFGGNDVARGLGDRDALCMGAGSDTASGGNGRDQLKGGPGRDVLKGGLGRDVLNGQKGKDRCNGGPGKDKTSKCERERKVP